MTYFADINERIDALRDLLGDVVHASDLPGAVGALDDAATLELMQLGGELAKSANQLCAVGAAVISRRSERSLGMDGVAQAQAQGHRSAVSLVQELTGATRADAAKQVRVGESLLEVSGVAEAGPQLPGDGSDDESTTPLAPWHACLSQALFAGTLTTAQHDAIRRGLGTPPEVPEPGGVASAAQEVWAVAASHLIEEATRRTAEELIRTARTIRDQLDPEGARRRFEARHLGRSFRTYTDADGIHHGHLTFEEQGFAWVRAIADAALRPRRGGPRFVDADQRAAAEDLTADRRTNDQLAYDLVIDMLRAGALADAKDVFGTRQAGIRIVHVVPDEATVNGMGGAQGATVVAGAASARTPILEDDGTSLPDWLVSTRSCDAGRVQVKVDGSGRPLDVGREQRLFTPRQRIALAVRDGGCMWRGCDRPASYCEAHHIDEWAADRGRTDVDRGILLCRYHHMTLHNGGWRISRDRDEEFLLHPPGGESPLPLTMRLARRYLWGVDPPPRRFRPAA